MLRGIACAILAFVAIMLAAPAFGDALDQPPVMCPIGKKGKCR